MLVILVRYFRFRFSLRSLMLAVLGLSGSIALLMSGSEFWITYGAIGVFTMVLLGLFWVASFDPVEEETDRSRREPVIRIFPQRSFHER